MNGHGRDQSRDSKHSIENMKRIYAVMLGVSLSVGAMAQSTLAFDSNAGMKSKMTVYDGTSVNYTSYERLFYVTNVEDSTYQFLNVYVPDGATQQTPIFLRTYVGGYMASPAAQPQAGDATGRALKGIPAFDSKIEGVNNGSGENEEFGDGKTSVAPHWYIRHGARDRDTAFPVPVNFATKLQNAGKDVNFLLAWNRPHSGDYALDELFQWIACIVSE